VSLVRAAGPAEGLYGAKITGGGSGGTVCVLGAAGERSAAAVKQLIQAYECKTGRVVYVVDGSSVGALEFGHVELRPRDAT